jgi:hypothetical protein
MSRTRAPRSRAKGSLRTLLNRHAVLFASTLVFGCSGQGGLAPAAYKAPKVGTVYRYTGGLTNTVTSVNGWRIDFVDNQGKPGSRLALFISQDPKAPLTVAPGELEKLWPLMLNKQVTITVNKGTEVYKWNFRVTSEENVVVAGRTYPCWLVQAVEEPVLVHSPKRAVSAVNTWWYSPDLNAVARFKTTYSSGPTAARVFQSNLENMGYGGADLNSVKKN